MASALYPNVSVVMPTYNHAEFIDRSIRSALEQTVPPKEIIVVDDGSTDGTDARVSAFGPPVRYVRRSNRGPSSARNVGIRLADGEWIALLDSDDVWIPRKLELQLELVARKPEISVVYGAMQLGVDPDRGLVSESSEMSPPDLMQALLFSNCITGSASCVLVRRACFEKVGLFDEQLRWAEDWDMWIRLAQQCRFGYVPEVLVALGSTGIDLSFDLEAMLKGRGKLLHKHRALYDSQPGGARLWRKVQSRTHVIEAQIHVRNGDLSAARRAYARAFLKWPFWRDVPIKFVRAALPQLRHSN